MKTLAQPRNLPILAYQHRACELRYLGTNSDKIALILFEEYQYRTSGSAIRHWFSNGGSVYDYYELYAAKHNEEMTRYTQQKFTAHVDKAQKTLMRIMLSDKGGMAQVKAAVEWLDRALGKVKN